MLATRKRIAGRPRDHREWSLAVSFTAVIGDRGEAGKLGNGFVGGPVPISGSSACSRATVERQRPDARGQVKASFAHNGSSSISEAISPSSVRD